MVGKENGYVEILCVIVGFLCSFDSHFCKSGSKEYQLRLGYGDSDQYHSIDYVGNFFFERQAVNIKQVDTHTWLFLILSGVATGLSWLFYFKALQTGDVSRVAPIDKLSVVITICLSFLFLKEPVSLRVIVGAVLITCGSIVMLLK